MNDQPVVNLYPDDPARPTCWASEDVGAPTIVLRKEEGQWIARFDRKAVAAAATAEQLTARLYGEFGLMAVLNEHGVMA